MPSPCCISSLQAWYDLRRLTRSTAHDLQVGEERLRPNHFFVASPSPITMHLESAGAEVLGAHASNVRQQCPHWSRSVAVLPLCYDGSCALAWLDSCRKASWHCRYLVVLSRFLAVVTAGAVAMMVGFRREASRPAPQRRRLSAACSSTAAPRMITSSLTTC